MRKGTHRNDTAEEEESEGEERRTPWNIIEGKKEERVGRTD